jgi:SAM-dependent methyltransferase
MHESAEEIGRAVFATYWRDGFTRILDIGSMVVNGGLRPCAPGGSQYVGVDLEAGPGVDVVLDDPYSYPFPDGHFDLVISTSCFEHDQMFWLTFLEAARVLSDRGVMYVNAPSAPYYHAFPGDNWRFMADAALGLEMWAIRNGSPIRRLESFIAYEGPTKFNDCVMVFTKDAALRPRPFLADVIGYAQRVWRRPG